MVFRGGPVLSLDVKGRVIVPSRWRDLLVSDAQGRLVTTKHPDGCLALYPLPVWDKLEAHLLGLTGENDAWRRLLLGSATDTDLDAGSRVLLPPELREWAQLDRQVKFIGMGAHFELWDPARHDAREAVTIAQGRPEPLRNMVIR